MYNISREEFIAWMERLLDKMDQIDRKISRKERLKNCLEGEELMDNQDVCLLLKISLRSLQYYRSAGKLPCYKINGKVYYKSSDVHQFIRQSFDGNCGRPAGSGNPDSDKDKDNKND